MNDKYLEMLVGLSATVQHERLLDCMEYAGANALRDVTDEDARDYLRYALGMEVRL